MSEVIILKLNDPDDFFYNSILSLISSHNADIQIITGNGTKICVAPDLTITSLNAECFQAIRKSR